MTTMVRGLSERVQEQLDRTVRARVQSHYGDLEIADVGADGAVVLRFSGACTCCPLRPMTVVGAVLPALEGVPGVTSVHVQGVSVSEAAVRRFERFRATNGRDAPVSVRLPSTARLEDR